MDDKRCADVTEQGRPCPNRAMIGVEGGKCARHNARLAPTPAQQEASRKNPVKHGARAQGLLEGEEGRYWELHDGALDRAALHRHYMTMTVLRAERAVAWEAEHGLTAAGNAAHSELRRAIAFDPPPAPPDHECLTPTEVSRQVGLLMRDPETFLRTLEPRVAEEVRAVLRAQGVLHAPP